MLSPEVINFEPPESLLLTQETQDENNCINTINKFPYAHLILVTLPDTFRVPNNLTQSLDNCDYYKISNLNLAELISEEFITCFVENGIFSAISINTRVDCDDSFGVTDNHLHLKLKKLAYQTLGLEGKPSHFHHKSKEYYVIKLDLNTIVAPGKSKYERIKGHLNKLNFDVILLWRPHDVKYCSSSIGKFFHDLGYKTELCRSKDLTHIHYSVKVPTEFAVEQHNEFIEWLGVLSVTNEVKEGSSCDYVSTYETPEPNAVMGQVKCLQWKGFFIPAQIEVFWNKLREYLLNSDIPWIAMYVQGFSDSVVGWYEEEHHFYTNGDNGYILFSDKNKFLITQNRCSRKRYKNHQ